MCNDYVSGPVRGKEDLRYALIEAGSSAAFHLRLFDDLGAVLHLDAGARALFFVGRVAHAQTAEPTWLIGCNGPRSSRQRQSGQGRNK